MEDPVVRARKLIMLAASPYEGEARTAAYLACRLIREHNIQLGRSAAPTPAPSPPRPTPPPAKRRVRQVWDRPMVAKYGGSCLHCSRWFRPGDRIHWRKQVGAVCLQCGPDKLDECEPSM
jgi:hypothetical protein